MILELTHRGGTAAFASLASDLLLTKRTAFFVMQNTDIVDEVQAELRRLDIPHTKITCMTHPKVGSPSRRLLMHLLPKETSSSLRALRIGGC